MIISTRYPNGRPQAVSLPPLHPFHPYPWRRVRSVHCGVGIVDPAGRVGCTSVVDVVLDTTATVASFHTVASRLQAVAPYCVRSACTANVRVDTSMGHCDEEASGEDAVQPSADARLAGTSTGRDDAAADVDKGATKDEVDVEVGVKVGVEVSVEVSGTGKLPRNVVAWWSNAGPTRCAKCVNTVSRSTSPSNASVRSHIATDAGSCGTTHQRIRPFTHQHINT
jgi:hypothetical protein